MLRDTVIFDGDCGVCTALKDWAKGRDSAGNLEFIAYQTGNLEGISPGLTPELASQALYFVGRDGRRFRGARAVFETMQRLRARDDILFVVVGRGTALPRLRAMCEEVRLPNIKFLPYQTQEVLPQMYASSDLQLVLQRAGLSRMSAPMKAYVIMSSGRPMLVSMDLDGEPAQLVRRADCGLCVPPESPALLAEAIEEATRDPARLRVWGENGRQYVVEHLSKEAVVAAYDGLLDGIVP